MNLTLLLYNKIYILVWKENNKSFRRELREEYREMCLLRKFEGFEHVLYIRNSSVFVQSTNIVKLLRNKVEIILIEFKNYSHTFVR